MNTRVIVKQVFSTAGVLVVIRVPEIVGFHFTFLLLPWMKRRVMMIMGQSIGIATTSKGKER